MFYRFWRVQAGVLQFRTCKMFGVVSPDLKGAIAPTRHRLPKHFFTSAKKIHPQISKIARLMKSFKHFFSLKMPLTEK